MYVARLSSFGIADAWRPFLFVNIHYEPFDAADWEPAGLRPDSAV